MASWRRRTLVDMVRFLLSLLSLSSELFMFVELRHNYTPVFPKKSITRFKISVISYLVKKIEKGLFELLW
jgi:hypothetical protein